MAPYANFLFFGTMLFYLVLPTVVMGWFGRANAKWCLLLTVLLAAVPLWDFVSPLPGVEIRELWIAAGYGLWQIVISLIFLKWRNRAVFYAAVILTIVPLGITKFLPLFTPEGVFAFVGISYVTFRALDVIFSINDKVITQLNLGQLIGYLFFFPTLSSGPIDRYRRFSQDWNRIRGWHEFLEDLDAAVQRVFQGFLYKFLIAALMRTYWVDPAAKHLGFWATANYMYAYTFYLFFDFAGYSAFAIGFSRLFGIRTPENFDKPFLSKNIRDFWNRWHISLSFWFRDHIYMRFLLTAGKKKWFKGKHTASYIGLFLTFGIMGLWHGPERHYILYGLYHATLLCCYDAFARWNKQTKFWKDGPAQRVADVVLTFHAFAFGLLLFSGRFEPPQVPRHEEIAERWDCRHLAGWAWDASKPNDPLNVDVTVDDVYVGRVLANEPRDDMRSRGFSNIAHGFTFKLPDYIRDGKEHTIDARVVDGQASRQLRNCPQVVTCELDSSVAPATPAAAPAPATPTPKPPPSEPSVPPAPPTLSATPVPAATPATPAATPAPAASPSAPPPAATPASPPAGQP